MKMTSLPLLRYKLKTFGEVGGFHFRQSADDPALMEMIFLDGDGVDFSSGMAKNLERIYYKENFRRAHHSEPGALSEINNVVDFYREGFLRAINREAVKKAAWTIVVDFNFSPASQILPPLLNELGCNVVALNAYVDDARGKQVVKQKRDALDQLSKIVSSLGANMGAWLEPGGEALTVLDETGKVLSDIELLLLTVALTLENGQKGVFSVPVQAPSTVELMAGEKGCQVNRTKSGDRAMLEAATASEILLAGTVDGRFAFPRFQASFDGMFTIARLIEFGSIRPVPFSERVATLPLRAYLQTNLSCPFEMKGGIMRKMSEDSLDKDATFIDGITVHFSNAWVLVLPDQYQPIVHIIAEAKDPKTAQQLLNEYQKKVESWKKELE
jgi:mannose-1-phosphate guanylyltransferase/phosphomannomutase